MNYVPLIAIAFVLILIVWFLAAAIKVVREYERLVVFRLGRVLGTKGPGLVILIPLVDRAVSVDLREFYLEIPHQSAITEDNASISIDFIVFNKVGSPQFMIWLAPVVVAGLVHDWRRWRTPAALLMGIAVTTFVIYPLFYTPLIHAHPAMAAVLTTRNVLLVVLLCWSVQRVARLQQVPARPAELATT